jgi:hypothetical protein
MIFPGQTIVYESTAEAFPNLDIRAMPVLDCFQALFGDVAVWKLANGVVETTVIGSTHFKN